MLSLCYSPSDGTTNFLSGLPLCAVSIGVLLNRTVVAGVIYNPITNQLTTATLGGGAFQNGVSITCGPERSLGESVINVGNPVKSDVLLRVSSKLTEELGPKVRGIRMLASAAGEFSFPYV
jgi:myo-inositol-1(or 4)-monophosphatase